MKKMLMKVGSFAVLVGCIGAYVMAPAEKDVLESYREKRDFEKTNEPKPVRGPRSKGKKGHKPIFVIQQHDATSMHYDFRLEIDGVLKSWAIPKGPSTNPHDKHLAIETEDHPMEYAKFEGVIPEGSYGAGPVLIWDTGTYEDLKEMQGKDISMDAMYKKGKIEIFLHGEKLEGAYALIKTKGMGDNKWLFFKMNDEYADARKNIIKSHPESVKSGKKINGIK
jgi:DNA ligase D-like protein (predicted 3'-phosphoesterase)